MQQPWLQLRFRQVAVVDTFLRIDGLGRMWLRRFLPVMAGEVEAAVLVEAEQRVAARQSWLPRMEAADCTFLHIDVQARMWFRRFLPVTAEAVAAEAMAEPAAEVGQEVAGEEEDLLDLQVRRGVLITNSQEALTNAPLNVSG